MIILGIAIVIVTFYAIVKNYETRVVLMLSGLLMAFIGGNLSGALNAFAQAMVNASLVPIICVTMGFSYVLDSTGCSKHLILSITGLLKKFKPIIIPATVILVWLLNIALMSASGLAAAVGAILIPMLIKIGIRPAIAASTVLLGTWGSSVSPGNPFIVQVADLAKMDLMTLITAFAPKAFACVVFSCIVFVIITKLSKKLSQNDDEQTVVDKAEEKFSVNYVYAVIPLVPIVLLLISSPAIGWIPVISVVNAMLLGTVLCFAAVRPEVKSFAKSFFKGNGDAFCEIVCLVAAAATFTAGMQIIGLTGALIDSMKNSAALAKFSAVFGPFIIAAISGSGNAAILAFNGSVTPHAASFGLTIGDMGSAVQAAGNLGRCMSPVAGVAIICAKIAGVSPMELTKYNAIPCILAAIMLMVLVLW